MTNEYEKKIRDLEIENASLRSQITGQQKELQAVQNHLDDMRMIVNRFTESNTTIKYSPIDQVKTVIRGDQKTT